MPINRQTYLTKSSSMTTLNVKMLNWLNQIMARINEVNDPKNQELKKKVADAQEAVAILFTGATTITDERFDEYMKSVDQIPSVFLAKIQPDDKQVYEIVTDKLNGEQTVQFMDDYKSFRNEYQLSITLSPEELQREAEEQKKKLVREAKGNPLEAIPTFTDEEKTGVKRTAAQVIDSLKASTSINTESTVAEIVAARLLADSDRGSADKLEKKQVYQSEVEATGRWLRSNFPFTAFFEANKEKIVKAAKTGHGGGVDDLLKDYIKKVPAGRMPTHGIYTRFMPTAYDRIDQLKKQIKNGQDPVKAAAEMVVLRNLVKAKQGKKDTLKVKLTPEQMQQLKDQTEKLANDPNFKTMMQDPAALDLAKKGHGGDLLEHLRNSEKKYPNMDKDTLAIMNAGTLGTHLSELSKKAGQLHKELKDELEVQRNAGDKRDMTKTWKIIDQSKELLAEYMACDNISRKPIKGQPAKEQRLLQDVPTDKIQEQIGKRDQNPVFRTMTDKVSPVSTVQLLDDMSKMSQDDFIRGLAEKHAQEMQEEKKSAGPAVREKEEPVAENQSILQG